MMNVMASADCQWTILLHVIALCRGVPPVARICLGDMEAPMPINGQGAHTHRDPGLSRCTLLASYPR